MRTQGCKIAGFRMQEAVGVRAIGASTPLRLTRAFDGASLVLHELSSETLSVLDGAAFDTNLPNFSRPFVTTFAGILHFQGSAFLVEPLPDVVPLLDVWQSVLFNAPFNAAAMLAALQGQLDELSSARSSRRQQQNAVCAANIVLTTDGTYGLLASDIKTPSHRLCVRPSPDRTVARSPGISGCSAGVIEELLQYAEGLGRLPASVLQGLQHFQGGFNLQRAS